MLSSRFRAMNVKSCAQKCAADIRQARSSAVHEGKRTQILVTGTGNQNNLGNGQNALWMTFSNYTSAGTYASGDRVFSCGSCSSDTRIETISGISSLPAGPVGPDPGHTTNLSMSFSALGTLLNASNVVDTSIIFTSSRDNSYKARVTIASLTGYARLQTCTKSGSVTCANSGDWKDIQ